MHVAIRLYDGVSFPDEAATKVRTEFMPIISKIPGFQEYYAVKCGRDKVASVSVFKDKPGSDDATKAASKWVQKNMATYLPNRPQSIDGDAFAHMLMGGKKTAA
jgi:hypothetical protein